MINTVLKRSKIYIFSLPLMFFITLIIYFVTNTDLYGIFLFVLLGINLFILSEYVGKQVYLYFLFPVLMISANLTGVFFLVDYFDLNGLNPIHMHPFTISWLVAFSIEIFIKIYHKALKIDKILILSIMLFFFYGIFTFYKRGFSGLSLLTECYVSPISFFIYFYYYSKIDYTAINRVLKAFIAISVFIGLYGVIEYLMKYNILTPMYESVDFYASKTDRILTIIGQPLMNAIFFLLALILTQVGIQDHRIKNLLMLFFLGVILLTGSRSMFFIGIIVASYEKGINIFKPSTLKIIRTKLVLIVLIIAIVFVTPFGNIFLNRMQNAKESTLARVLLFNYFINNFRNFAINGLGYAGENIKININENKYQDNKQIILENPWIMAYIDLNFISLLYIGFLILIFWKIKEKYFFIAYILAISGFNSFGVRSPASYYLFFLLTVLYIWDKLNENTDSKNKANSIEQYG